jgi:hypothetical protein
MFVHMKYRYTSLYRIIVYRILRLSDGLDATDPFLSEITFHISDICCFFLLYRTGTRPVSGDEA